MNFNFGEVLSRAWQIIWKNKVLWIFGILASCTRGNGGGGGGGGNTGYQFSSGDGQTPFSGGREMEQMMGQFFHWLNENWWVIALIVLALILISLAFYVIGFIGKIGLIKGTYKADQGAESLNFGELFSESLPYFWRVFGLSFLVGLAVLVVLIPMVLFGFITAGLGFLCLIPILCILVPVIWVLAVVLEQAYAAIVIEDLRMFDGLKRGWEIAKANIGTMIIMALILLIGGGIASLIIVLPMFLAFIPLIPSIISGDFQTSSLWFAALCCAGAFPVVLVLNGILTAYIQSAWTLTFMRLAAPKADTAIVLEANA